MVQHLYSQILKVPYKYASFDYMNIETDGIDTKRRLEKIITSFLDGYHMALTSHRNIDGLGGLIDNAIATEFQGFAYEGAGMSLALMDVMSTSFGIKRVNKFLESSGKSHHYMIIIGVGFMFARIPWMKFQIGRYLRKMDPMLCWLAIDGYGFHEGYFRSKAYIVQKRVPRHLDAYALKCFDHGIGRSLWFVCGASPNRIYETIQSFPAHRWPDLWCGVGLASAYAGGVAENVYRDILEYCSDYLPEFGQGVVLAAHTRIKSNTTVSHTDVASRIFLDISQQECGRIFDAVWDEVMESRENMSEEETMYAGYEIVRKKIQLALSDRIKSNIGTYSQAS